MVEEVREWIPKTKLGKMVKNGEITNMKDVLESELPLMESEIVDTLLQGITEEVIDIDIVQRMHGSGRRVRFRATVAVGNKDGYVGLGKGTAKEVGPAIRKAIRDAKLNIIGVERGCGSWECTCSMPHSVPYEVKGSAGSVRVKLIPAPKGVGLAAGDISKKLLVLAGIKDAWSKTFGQTKTTLNTAKATFYALRQTAFIKLLGEKNKEAELIEGKAE